MVEVPISQIACCSCGIVFWMSSDFDRRLRTNHDTFHCPNGHAQSYTTKTDKEMEIESLNSKLKLLQENLAECQIKLAKKGKKK